MKKVKLISSLLSFCFALAVLCFGVYAAQTVNYTIGGTLSYVAEDVYATVTGTVTGTSESITYSNLVYNPTTPSTPSAADLATWSQNLTFSSPSTPIVITINITNNSEENDLYVKIVDNHSTISNVTKAQTYDSSTYTMGEYKTISKKTGQTAVTKTFVLTMSVTNPTTSISEAAYEFVVYLQTTNPTPALNIKQQLTHNTGEFYYLTMGTYNNNPAKWRLLRIGDTYIGTNTDITNLTGTAIFVQETYAGTHAFMASSNYAKASNNNYYVNAGTVNGIAVTSETIYANDYYVSDIRHYLNDETNSGFAHALGIESNNAIYNAIQGKALSDLYAENNTTGHFNLDNTTLATTDKFWLLSKAEAYGTDNGNVTDGWFTGGDTDRMMANGDGNLYDDDERSGGSWWWLRSSCSGSGRYTPYAYFVYLDGGIYDNFVIGDYSAVRAAFQITIG